VSPKTYCQAVGVVLLLVGVVGFVMPDLMGMDLGAKHSVVHLVTGAIFAWLGFGGAAEALTKNLVLLFGVVYTLLGVAGFVVDDLVLYRPDTLVNIIHLAVGLLALFAATAGAKAPAAA
jgi:hypothetical protein